MSIRTLIPSNGALFMFEAAARHLNFTAAAQEFNVTQPAVSRTVGKLEAHLGVALFERHPGGLRLTENGKQLQQAVEEGFGRIGKALENIAQTQQGAQTVTISLTSAFTTNWLLPRYDRFRAKFPDISLRFELIHGEPNGPLNGADLAVRYDVASDRNTEAWPLVEEIVMATCSPPYLERHGSLKKPEAEQGKDHILAVLMGQVRIPWDQFQAATAGDPLIYATRQPFSDYALIVQAALKGQCISLGWWHVVAHELMSGGLVLASDALYRTGKSYHLVADRHSLERRAVRKVRDWMIDEFASLESTLAELRGPSGIPTQQFGLIN
ncbi:LysR substrate-binding domain-containing protein [Thioclava kandeliae]|uniref:LysR substrate-binding domain-containing protein n=1 Tax=Thioclava kandeliae TaxID=3070818 RepID=A0ABV1SLN7_9RHOB